jgi:hypothetical protein
MITGGFMLGRAHTLLDLGQAYYTQLGAMVADGQYCGNDQFVLSRVTCARPDLVQLVLAEPHVFVQDNPWFFGVPFLLGAGAPRLDVRYINLDRRPDRNALLTRQWQELLPAVALTRVSATDMPERPALGCLLSHIKALAAAPPTSSALRLIAEDDFCFKEDPQRCMQKLGTALQYLDGLGWDVILLGAPSSGSAPRPSTPSLRPSAARRPPRATWSTRATFRRSGPTSRTTAGDSKQIQTISESSLWTNSGSPCRRRTGGSWWTWPCRRKDTPTSRSTG